MYTMFCAPCHTAGSELLVWYGEEYARDLGIEMMSAHAGASDTDSEDSSAEEPKPSKLPQHTLQEVPEVERCVYIHYDALVACGYAVYTKEICMPASCSTPCVSS